MDLNEFSDAILMLPEGNIILNELLEAINSIQSPDDITEFFNVLNVVYKYRGHIHSDSPIGVFVGEMLLTFENMMFEGLSRLYDELLLYRQESSFKGFLSPIESINFLDSELKNIEHMIGKVTCDDINRHIEKIKTIIPDIPKVHLLSYKNYLLNGDFASAVDKLYQYFDYAIEYELNHAMLNQKDDYARNGSSFKSIPYAPLSLASLHIQFGHIEEAKKLVLEAMRFIQGSDNEHALIVALSLMCQIYERENNHHELFNLLQICSSLSKKVNNREILSNTALFLSKFLSIHPTREINLEENGFKQEDKIRPYDVLKSMDVSMKFSFDYNCIENVHTSFVKSIISRIDIWKTFGDKNILNLLSQITFQNSTQGYKVPDHSLSPLLYNLAIQFASNGNFEVALKVLSFAKNHYPQSPFKSNWIISMRQVLHEWTTQRHHFNLAELHTNQLSLVSSNTSLSHFFDALYRHSIMLMHKGALDNASSVLSFVIYGCNSNALQYQTVGYLLTLADIHIKAGSFATSIPYILESITLSDKYKQQMINNLAKLKLAEVYIRISDSPHILRKSSKLIGLVTPYILEHGTISMKAVLKLTSLKVQLQNHLILKDKNSSSLLKTLNETESIVVQSKHVSLMIEFYYISARIYHFIGDIKNRNKSSKIFRNLCEKKEHPEYKNKELNVNHFYVTYDSMMSE